MLNILTSDPNKIMLVPPDPERQYVSKQQYIKIFRDGAQADGHGFNFIDADEETASNGTAGYYSWNPEPGVRFISLDTVSEAGVIGPSANGNIDDPQFQWLTSELDAAETADELVVLFSHHAIPSLSSTVEDELAGPCSGPDDSHGHNTNPGCDPDPRTSTPLHLGPEMIGVLHGYPNVIAWVAGHSHENQISPYANPSGGGFWSIRVAAEADWPQQGRLLEIFDNKDGTLSIFGTIVDLAAPATSVEPGTDAATLDSLEIASLGRTIGYNEPQYGAESCNPVCEGGLIDRNVELMLADPRRGDPPPPPPPPPGVKCGRAHNANLIEGTRRDDKLAGTKRSDKLLGRDGDDRLRGKGGRDCARGGRGNDLIRGGDGRDRLAGNRHRDKLVGGPGRDKLLGGGRKDKLFAIDGERDIVNCGKGRDDVALIDEFDVVKNCEALAGPGA